MEIREWLRNSSLCEKESLIKKVNTTIGYLRQLAGKHKRPGWKLALQLEEATKEITPGRVISKNQLRPDIADAFDQDKK